MLASHPEASYLLAVSELAPTSTQAAGLDNGSAVIGVCAVDTATSSFMVGQVRLIVLCGINSQRKSGCDCCQSEMDNRITAFA
jgi:hypothetical protein